MRQAAQDHAPQRHRAMGEPADQDDRDAGFVVAAILALAPGFVLILVLGDRVLVGDEAEAGGGRDARIAMPA
jgi:hypothetical protein